MGWVLLLVNWLVEAFVEGDWHNRWQRAKQSRLLQAFVLLYALHIAGLLWSGDMAYALDDLRKKLPMVVLPMVLLTSRPLADKERKLVFAVYLAAVTVVSAIGFVRWLTIPDLPHRHIVPFISHIRFSLNLCFCICLLIYSVAQRNQRNTESEQPTAHAHLKLETKNLEPNRCASLLKLKTNNLKLLLALWMLFFLVLLQSFTGIIALCFAALAMLVAGWSALNKTTRRLLLAAWVAVVCAALGLTSVYVADYYRLKPPSSLQPRQELTANGRPYTHMDDGFVESGNYLNNYVCDAELRSAWASVSDIPLDSLTPNGYPVYPALLRYLNAMGCTKDSLGASQLTPADIEAIVSGVANPVYLKRVSLRRMCYVMCYEFESYRCYRRVVDFTMLQRFELWRAGWNVFRQHPLFGVGTGDVVDECHAWLDASGSPLAGTTKHTHCQYLTLLITFGLAGFLLIAIAFARAFARRRHHSAPLLAALLTIVLVSFLTEDTLETLAGCMFAIFPMLLLWEEEKS